MSHVSLSLDSLKGRLLGNGCFSRVYEHAQEPDKWVIKVGTNDGTRTYLEWCKRRQSMGQGLKGMPKVAWVVSTDEHQYAACLERLPIDPGKEENEDGYRGNWKKYLGEDAYYPAAAVPYLQALAATMRKEIGVRGNDMHFQNFLVRKDGTVVLTDPDSGDYSASPYIKEHPPVDPVGPAVQQDLFARGFDW